MLQWLTDGEPTVAVLEFVTVGTDHTAFLSGSVKGGGRLEGTFGKPTTHYKLRITLNSIFDLYVYGSKNFKNPVAAGVSRANLFGSPERFPEPSVEP